MKWSKLRCGVPHPPDSRRGGASPPLKKAGVELPLPPPLLPAERVDTT